MPVEQLDLDIEGMHCAACVTRIERFLKKVDGVEDASVNLMTNRASVTYSPVTVNEDSLVGAVAKAGYKASLHRSSESTETKTPRSWRDGAEDLIPAAFLAIPALVVGMGWTGRPVWADWLLAAVTGVVVFGFGRQFFAGAWSALRSGGGATMDTLIAIGASAAWGYSFSNLVDHASRETYFETGSTIVTLILMGRYLEGLARRRASAELRGLASLSPTTAFRINDSESVEVSVADIALDDLIRIRPGEKAAVDGTVVEGVSEFDESLLTGESKPIVKRVGDTVIGGSLNMSGVVIIRASAVGADTVLANIVRLVEQAQAAKPPVQRLADRISAVFVPAVLAVSAITFGLWMLHGAPVAVALKDAVAVLVIACPCALGLATPTAILVSSGRAASMGFLVRDGAVLETAKRITTVVFDKTGTLTEGKFAVTDIWTHNGYSNDKVLIAAAAVEQNSEHVIGTAIVSRAQSAKLEIPVAKYFKAVPGEGVRARVDGGRIVAGTVAFLVKSGIDVPTRVRKSIQIAESQGKTVVCIGAGTLLIGRIALSDTVRVGAAPAINQLREMGVATVMLTGDNERVARQVAAQLGIEKFEASVMPEGKSAAIERLRRESRGPIAMVGDGVNDAAALAAADVGIAMGRATDVAREAAAVTLMRTDLSGVASLILLSRRTVATIYQNLFWAVAFNVIGIPLAAFGRLNPMIAALAMAFSSVAVVTNSIRLRKAKLGNSLI